MYSLLMGAFVAISGVAADRIGPRARLFVPEFTSRRARFNRPALVPVRYRHATCLRERAREPSKMPIRFSFIVPFHDNVSALERCLSALRRRPPASELVVVADAAGGDFRQLASRYGARVIVIEQRSGPAVARNIAARHTTGDVLVFVDADVVVARSGLLHLEQIFAKQPHTAAAFGSYDDKPADPGFMSQYKNLSHSYIHRSSCETATTFWTGFGAVRRSAFQAVGGFDERFQRPSVEDIDFGYRLTKAGFRITLDSRLIACHLKRWTLGSAISSDIRDRGIPWMQLILKYGALNNDLNLRIGHRVSMVLAYLAVAALVLALRNHRVPYYVSVPILAMTIVNQRYYRFFYSKRGASFAVRAWLLHVVHHLYNGLSFAIGTGLFVGTRYFHVRIPGALPLDPWGATDSQLAPAADPSPVWSADSVI